MFDFGIMGVRDANCNRVWIQLRLMDQELKYCPRQGLFSRDVGAFFAKIIFPNQEA